MSAAPDLRELIPLALVVASSPLSIIPAVLVLQSARPRPSGLAFLAGWLIGIAATTAVFVGASDIAGDLNRSPAWAAHLRIAIGVALIAFAAYRWLTRNRSGHTPKWLNAMRSVGPRRAFLTALILCVANPKVLAMCAAAGLVIGTAALGTAGAWQADALFTAVAASSVAAPVLAYVIAGDRLRVPLERLKVWMERNHAAMMAVILAVIGAALLYEGIRSLR